MSKRRKKKIVKLSIVFMLGLFIGLVFLISGKGLDYKNFVKVYNLNINYIDDTAEIVLKSECYELVFYTSRDQGENIKIALQNLKTERPSTHDLLLSIIEKFNLNLKELRITKLENGIYYGNLVFENFFGYIFVDTRPSDGVAIALRANKPIFVNKDLVENLCLGYIL